MIQHMCGWVRWHGPELAATVAPTVAAVTVSPWWALLSAGAVGRWVLHEVRLRRDAPSPPDEPARADERDNGEESA